MGSPSEKEKLSCWLMMELLYFDVMALGLGPALALELSGLPWSRRPLDRALLKEDKVLFPFGQVPVLIDNETKVNVAQSSAIAQYIGRKAAMNGADEAENIISDVLFAAAQDIYQLLQAGVPTVYVKLGEGRKGDHAYHIKTLEELIPRQLAALEAMLESRMGRWSESGKTIGEIFLFAMTYQLVLVQPTALSLYPNLLAEYNRFSQLPGVKNVLQGTSAYGAWKQYFQAAE